MLDLLFAEAAIGRDAEDFLKTDIGRYIIGRCEQEIDEAQELLSKVSPWRRRRIQELQNKIYRAKSLKGWLVELVDSGKAAEAVLSDINQED